VLELALDTPCVAAGETVEARLRGELPAGAQIALMRIEEAPPGARAYTVASRPAPAGTDARRLLLELPAEAPPTALGARCALRWELQLLDEDGLRVLAAIPIEVVGAPPRVLLEEIA
jgi:hypothetical protein